MSNNSTNMIVVINQSANNFIEKIDKDFIKTETFFVKYQKLENLYKIVGEALDRVKGKVLATVDESAQEHLDGKIVVPSGKITRVFDTIEEKETFDEKTFKIENPELYQQYTKKQLKEKKGFVKITPDTLIKRGLENNE